VRAVPGRWCSARAAGSCAAKSVLPFDAGTKSPAVVRGRSVLRPERHGGWHCSGDTTRRDATRRDDGTQSFHSDY
jgi:hypothetical protein